MKTPDGWKKVKFGEVVNHIKERVPNREEWNFDRYISGDHIDNGEIRITRSSPIEGNEEVIGSAFHMRFKHGQVLYVTRRGYLRKCGIVDIEGICSNVTFTLETDKTKLLQTLLPFIMQTESFVEHATSNAHGSTNPFLNWKDIAKYEFSLPPLDEQTKISEVLWGVEEAIKKLDVYLIKLKTLKIKVQNKELNMGNIVSVKDITIEHKQGFYTDEFYVDDGINLVRITDLQNPRIDFSTMPKINISEKNYEQFKILKKDFLIARSGAIGRYGIYDSEKEAVFASYIIRFRFDPKKITSEYFGHLFSSKICLNQLNIISQRGANVNINAENIKKLKIPLPSLVEQDTILKKLNKVDRLMEDLVSHFKSLKNIRDKLSNDLLSGNMRVD